MVCGRYVEVGEAVWADRRGGLSVVGISRETMSSGTLCDADLG
jgi:hypothetical protein